MAKFVVFYNNELLKTYELSEPVFSIGRLPENTISIANMGVSRRHVKIEEDADRSYILSDLNSLNGTFVNGKRIKKVQLQHGDKIAIGKYTILYEVVSGDAAGANSVDQEQRAAVEAPGYSGTMDFSYVHRTTEPRMRPIPSVSQGEELGGSGSDVVDAASDGHADKEGSGAVLIETNKHVVYKIDKPYLTMGSGEEDDIFISGFMVGESQVSIEVQDDGTYISSNRIMSKMKINGKPRRHYLLKHKDRIEVGASTFRFMENG